MAFWIKKKNDENEGAENTENALIGKKKKDEKRPAVKRIDNLRIPQQLNVTLRSVGSPNEFQFLTKDLSATGAFVLCNNFKRYPFQPASTLLDVVVELKNPETQEILKMPFMAKIARVVEAHGVGAMQISGFGIRIVQMSLEQRTLLENFIARHGSPDVAGQAAELIGTANLNKQSNETEVEDQDFLSDDTLPKAM